MLIDKMAAVDTSRYNDLCRLCATKTAVVLSVHIFHNEEPIGQLRKKIESCLPIHIHESDELPKIVCGNCLYKLDMFSEFRERTIRTEKLLIDLIKEFNTNKSHGNMSTNVVSMDHNDMIMVEHHQLLNNSDLPNVGEIDLSQLGSREQMIVEHEIILTHHNVDINSHSLDNLDLNNHQLTNQNISNHNLQTQDPILIETNNSHEIEDARFVGNNLDLLQQHQLLSNQFRLQHGLHVNISEANAVNEITLSNELSNSVNHVEINKERIVNSHDNYTHEDLKSTTVENHIVYHKSVDSTADSATLTINSHINNIRNHNDYNLIHCKMESPKQEDSNSDTSLLIDDSLNSINESNKQVYVLQTDNNLNDDTVQSLTTAHNIDWFYCNICGKAYEQKCDFEKHYEIHYLKCSVCFAIFTTTENLNSHIKIHEVSKIKIKKDSLSQNQNCNSPDSASEGSKGDFVDDQVEDEESENKKTQLIENSKSKRKVWSPKICEECGKSYKTNYKLTEHMRKHTGEKPFKCRSCDKKFRSKIGLAQHEAKHTGQYDYECPKCGKGFQCKSYLMVHQRVHSDVKPYPCTTCGRNFKTKQSLLDHTNRHLGVKPYMCEICGRGFITKGLCRAHQKVHSGLDNRKYSCKICSKMFVSKSYLQTHLRIHTGEKPFICEVCGKGFLTKVDLKIHSTMHTGEKSYVCEMCGKAFARRDALRCHRRSHTGERPYSCDVCGQTFTQFTPMAIHKRLHTGERPYTCEDCGKTFVSRSTMMAHAKKHLP